MLHKTLWFLTVAFHFDFNIMIRKSTVKIGQIIIQNWAKNEKQYCLCTKIIVIMHIYLIQYIPEV